LIGKLPKFESEIYKVVAIDYGRLLTKGLSKLVCKSKILY